MKWEDGHDEGDVRLKGSHRATSESIAKPLAIGVPHILVPLPVRLNPRPSEQVSAQQEPLRIRIGLRLADGRVEVRWRINRHVVVLRNHAGHQARTGLIANVPALEDRLFDSRRGVSRRDQIEYVPVPPDPLVLDPDMLPEPLLDDENDDPLDLLPDVLLEEPVDEPLVEPDPEPDALAEPDACVAEVAETSFTPLVASSAGRSLWVHTPSAE